MFVTNFIEIPPLIQRRVTWNRC